MSFRGEVRIRVAEASTKIAPNSFGRCNLLRERTKEWFNRFSSRASIWGTASSTLLIPESREERDVSRSSRTYDKHMIVSMRTLTALTKAGDRLGPDECGSGAMQA